MKLDDFLKSFEHEFKQTSLGYYINSIIKPYRKFPDEYSCYTLHLLGPIKIYSFRVGFVICEFKMTGLWHEVHLYNKLNDEELVMNSGSYKYLNSVKDIEEINSTLFDIFD